MGMNRHWLLPLVLAGTLLVAPASVEAQQNGNSKGKQNAQRSKNGDQGDAQLRARIDQLEEQLTDMQVMIGTLESLARGGNAGSVGQGGGGGLQGARVDSLETQIRALTSQVQQLSDQVRQLTGSRRGDAGISPPATAGFGAQTAPLGYPQQQGRAEPSSAPSAIPGFGSTTVTPGRDPIGQLIGPNEPQNASANSGSDLPPGAATAANPRELYETAYGYLLQQDYGAAEVAFGEFLRRFPSDRLTADAQYWLGETLYVQRRYKPAGQAFLAVIERHKSSSKVANSLLKLAQSLEHLGQKDCGIFVELEQRHANAPADVRVKARALKQRQGC